ncbi:MAG: erythromycin esterase family protein [Halolamina sp.]
MTNDTTDTTQTAPNDEPTAPAVRAGLRAHAHGLVTCDPATDLDAGALPDEVADVRIVALGEGTHGTREFFRLKHRLLRWLVTEAGVRTFAMEANAPEARALDEYVVHGRGDPEAGLSGLYFWTWQTEEVLALVEWLRSFNEGRPIDDRVRFRGFDAQYTQGAVHALLDRFGDDLPAGLADNLELVADDGNRPTQDDRVEERIEAAETVVPRLRERADTDERASYCLRVIEQATAYKRRLLDWASAPADNDAEAAAMEAVLRVRDRAMAENVEWLERRSAGPVVLWAHDAHGNRDRHASRKYDVSAPSMGSHLSARYGDDYYAVGFTFARGSFQAIDRTGEGRGLVRFRLRDPRPGTLESVLDAAEVGPALLDLRAGAADSRLEDWLATRRQRLSIGATYDGDPAGYLTAYSLGEAFDALCFVPETTRARPLSD